MTALSVAIGLADLIGSITVIEMMMSLSGTIALAILVGAELLCDLVAAFLILITGPVVEVLHSGQFLLYGASLRPHFRQNGIYSLWLFREQDGLASFKL